MVREAFYCVSHHHHNSVKHTCSTLALTVAGKWSHWRRKQTTSWGGRGSQESERDTGCPLPLLTAPPHLLNQRRAAFLALHIYWLRYMNTTLDTSVCDTPRCGTMACFPFLCFLSFTKGRSGAMTKEGFIPSQVLEERLQCVVWSPETIRVQREREIQKKVKV